MSFKRLLLWAALAVGVLSGCAPSGSVLGEGSGSGGAEVVAPGVFVEGNGSGGGWPTGAFLPAEWWGELPGDEEAQALEGIVLAHRPVRRGPAAGVRRPPPLLRSRPAPSLAQYGIRRTVDPRVVEQTRRLYYQRLAEAQQRYPSSMGYENHHVIPRYLTATPEGTTFRLRTAYHKAITQEFRREWEYGRSGKPDPQQLMDILIRVYGKYPIPQLVGIEP